MRSVFKSSIALLLGVFVASGAAVADERLFTYSYEADVLPEGQWEFEQWVTSRIGRNGGDYARWDFRSEFEYGLTEKLTTAIYFNFKDVYFSPNADNTTGKSQDGMEFTGISSEWKYQLMNPNLDPFGLLLYGEVTSDAEEFKLEEKIILQKNMGNWVTVLNGIVEQEWKFKGGETEKESELAFTAGVSYKLNPSWAVGIEGRNVQKFEDSIDLADQSSNAWYVGPNVHYGTPTWWATLTVLPQVTRSHLDLDDNENVHVRVIFGRLL